MAFLDELKRAQVSPVSVYQQFLLKNRSSPGCVHAFFEGHGDQSFYGGTKSQDNFEPKIRENSAVREYSFYWVVYTCAGVR